MPRPWSESRPLPGYRALLAVDAKDFTGLPAILHAPVSRLIPELVDTALDQAGLTGLKDAKRFPASTGDGIVFGFDPEQLPFVVSPLLRVLDEVLSRHNSQQGGARIRLRASVHVGPLPDSGAPGDGNGKPRNDTHRLLDSRPVKAVLAAASEHTTHLAAIISDRVHEDVILGGYTGLHPDHCVEVPATVEGKSFAQRAWLYVPSPSGNLLAAGVMSSGEDSRNPESSRSGSTGPERPSVVYRDNSQQVEGIGVLGSVEGGISYQGPTAYRADNQHWGSGDNVSGTKHVGGTEERR
ncbi:hypothetical protein CUT44_15550 [Streptomyces carminius]|uniref:Guanylate cyclase domain-containing protein n=2 Tax=Streptomyces carminius TaxID=2665496 RepID=A0A2M8LYD4_9ACTN|nr:hypothetical protein CUT44_15550 [Streptomyces carminius]